MSKNVETINSSEASNKTSKMLLSRILKILKNPEINNFEKIRRFFNFDSFYEHNDGIKFIFKILNDGKLDDCKNLKDKEEVITTFLRKISPDKRDKLITSALADGKTILHIALEYSMVRLSKDLIDRGADLFKRDKDGRMPISLIEKIDMNNETLRGNYPNSIDNVYFQKNVGMLRKSLVKKYQKFHIPSNIGDNNCSNQKENDHKDQLDIVTTPNSLNVKF